MNIYRGRSGCPGVLQFTSDEVESVLQDLDVKVFDRMRYQMLLNDMSLGIEPTKCMWLGSYLSGRIQKIRIGDAVSKDIKVTSGVPQGSHLGPLCFIWFVNRISEIFVYVRVLFYADDMKLFRPVSGFQKFSRMWDRTRSSELHKRSWTHHGRENNFFGACERHCCKGLCGAIGFIRRLSL
jgi:hypothetical protein